MNWKRTMAEERAALKRIVALLLALADLAERAGSRPPIVRGFVLWVLLRAEAVARDLAAETCAPGLLGQHCDNRADATRLAARFQELAHQLDCQAALAFAICSGDSRYGEPAPPVDGRALPVRSAINFAAALPFPTSARNTACLVGLPDTS